MTSKNSAFKFPSVGCALLLLLVIFDESRQKHLAQAQSNAEDTDNNNYYSSNNQENYGEGEYLSDWSSHDWGKLDGRIQQPKCVEIPSNMSLCYGIGYEKMMIPNLLDHDSMSEVTQQASSWVPLTRINCHPDVKMFLCSLFSPVCLERLIYPCRSLCEGVQASCVGRMKAYGFDWPDMLKCDKFPLDNDLCIRLIHDVKPDNNCTACKHPLTHESLIDQFCRSDIAMRASIKEFKDVNGHKELILRKKTTLYKHQGLSKNQVRGLKLIIEGGATCSCETINSTEDRYLLMGNKRGDQMVISFGMVWNRKDREFKKGITAIRKENTCEGIIRELASNGIENKPTTSVKIEKPKKKTENKASNKQNKKTENKDSSKPSKKQETENKDNNKHDKKKKTNASSKKTSGKKGKNGRKEKKPEGKKNKSNQNKPKSSATTHSKRGVASTAQLEDQALNNFKKAAN